MSDRNTDAGGGPRPATPLVRWLPAVGRLARSLNARSRQRVEGLYWILALLGTLPALRAALLFPTSWLGQWREGLALAGAENVFGVYAWPIALVVCFIVCLFGRTAHFVAALPFALAALADGPAGQALPLLGNAYVLAAFVTFAWFVVAGRTRSLYFFAYVTGLVVAGRFDAMLATDRIATFVVVAVAGSLVYETWRQNRPMLRELGRERFVALTARTFLLWSPTVLLIATGLTISQRMSSTAEQLIYAGTFVERHCRVVGGPPDFGFPCPASGGSIRYQEIERVLEETPDGNRFDCYFRPYVLASRARYYGESTQPPTGPMPAPNPCPAEDIARVVPIEELPRPLDPTWRGEAEMPDLRVWPVERLPFEPSLDLSVARQFEVNEWRIQAALRSADRAALDNSQRAGPEARRLFSVVPETPGIVIADCEWYDLPCHIVGMVKRSLIDAYVRVRARTERSFVNQMQARADALAAGVTDTTGDVGTIVTAGVRDWSNATRDSIARVFGVYRILNVLAMLWLIVIAIKSFLYVFARVIFDKATDVHVDLSDTDTPTREGRARAVSEVTIPGDYPHAIYYKSNYQPLGPAPRFTIPQPFASLFARLRFGAWNLSHVPMPCDDDRGLTFNSVQADYLVDWELQEGEEVVFRYGNFVAMNANIELRTIVSLRVSSLLLGRLVFHAARCTGGPGRLILRTRGRPATAEQVRRSIPVTRLIAWNSFARFSVDSHLTCVDIFLNGFNLRRSEKDAAEPARGILIVEADARDGGVLFGTLRFAKHFLLPV